MQLFDEIEKQSQKPNSPVFRVGDTLKVNMKIKEGEKTRIQAFEGVCVARANKGLRSSFTVRKVSDGIGVERLFPLHCPDIDSVVVLTQGDVRRGKLYYLRELFGRASKIKKLNTNQSTQSKSAGSKAKEAKASTPE